MSIDIVCLSTHAVNRQYCHTLMEASSCYCIALSRSYVIRPSCHKSELRGSWDDFRSLASVQNYRTVVSPLFSIQSPTVSDRTIPLLAATVPFHTAN